MAATTFSNAGRFLGRELLRPAWEHLNQAAVTSAAAFMSAMFSMQHGLLPWWIAVPLSIGLEWTYLRGLAAADKTIKTRWSEALNWSAMITSVVFSILFILGFYGAIPEHPEGWVAALLAFAHAVPPAVLSFCGASLRRVRKESYAKLAQQEKVAAVARKLQDDEHKAELQRQREEMALDLERQYKEARLREEIKAMRRPAKVFADTTTSEPSSTALRTPTNTVHEQSANTLREQVVNTLREHPETNKSQLAKDLGIGRTYLYELIKEARSSGELP